MRYCWSDKFFVVCFSRHTWQLPPSFGIVLVLDSASDLLEDDADLLDGVATSTLARSILFLLA